MFDEFINFLNENLGWVVGTELDFKKKSELIKPRKQDDETQAEYFQRIINWTKTSIPKDFKTKYWKEAKYKRIALVIAFLLLITNPSLRSFKEHLGREQYTHLSRQYNFFLFSVYKFDHYEGSFSTYLGIGGNFIDLTI